MECYPEIIGILKQAGNAKTQTDIAEEKELVESATIQTSSNNKYGNIEEDKLKECLKNQTDKPFDIYNSEGKIRVVFLDNNSYYDIDQEGTVDYLGMSKKGLEIGDNVTYIPPEASYLWDGKYSGEGKDEDENGEIDKTEINNTDSNYSITKWKVLNIKGSKVDLVASKQTVGKLYLSNPQGYNNAVKLLNDACSTLYSNKEKGITARSINIEDIEDKLTKEAMNSIAQTTAIYNGKIVAYYNNQDMNTYRNIYSTYPKIYAEEYRSVINGITKKDGLKRSEQTTFMEPDIGTETDWGKIGRINNVTSIQPYLIYYNRSSEDLKNDFKKQVYYDMLIRPNNNYISYWIGSRCVKAGGWVANFDIFSVSNGGINPKILYISYGDGRNEKLEMLPIVTVNTELLTEKEDTDNWIIK